MATRLRRAVSAEDVTAVRPVIRRFLSSAGADPQQLDDLVQETVARLLEARPRLEPATLSAYALTTASNLARSDHREGVIASRHQHRLYEDGTVDDPAPDLVLAEEHDALRRALEQLPEAMRAELLERYASVGSASPDTTGAGAARLARARAALRVHYLLALRRVSLPSPRCRPVLLALSAHDQRRQRALGAGRHLLACPTCRSLAEPLVHRSRGLAALIPVPVLLAGIRRAKSHPVAASAGAGAVVVASVVAAVAVAPDHAPAPPVPPPAPSALCALARHEPAPTVGDAITTTGVTVSGVPGDEVFTVSPCDGLAVTVRITGRGESAVTVRRGRCAVFSGTVAAVTPSRVRVRQADLRVSRRCPSAAA